MSTRGVRDPEFPCAAFEPGEPAGVRTDNGALCMGDGHYLCGVSLLERSGTK